jgi:hypothetical protein
MVSHSQDVFRMWPMRMSTSCRYDNKHADERCEGCTKPYDEEYVKGLK